MKKHQPIPTRLLISNNLYASSAEQSLLVFNEPREFAIIKSTIILREDGNTA